MTEVDKIIQEIALAFFALKSGTKIEKKQGNKRLKISVEKA